MRLLLGCWGWSARFRFLRSTKSVSHLLNTFSRSWEASCPCFVSPISPFLSFKSCSSGDTAFDWIVEQYEASEWFEYGDDGGECEIILSLKTTWRSFVVCTVEQDLINKLDTCMGGRENVGDREWLLLRPLQPISQRAVGGFVALHWILSIVSISFFTSTEWYICEGLTDDCQRSESL